MILILASIDVKSLDKYKCDLDIRLFRVFITFKYSHKIIQYSTSNWTWHKFTLKSYRIKVQTTFKRNNSNWGFDEGLCKVALHAWDDILKPAYLLI